ncbi:DUF4132 domain-containing protein [Sandaracinus amylolyticus]|uniref:DUF4132 domain-containing protein n=1 Tax=Sandaracinus amylolyticus TaxID=927083 RepID=UPI001F16E552|nr:DUF4132 domain-containing protein [Sandaracinus amylolyticus]UJR85123.1 Hypothetical protein I5071_72030 [Sandaracinus amylolyticus]
MAKPKKSAKTKSESVVGHEADGGWIDTGTGYALALQGGKIVARNAAGKTLASVPKPVKDTDAHEMLEQLVEHLDAHERSCRETVETWMLRSLPTPRTVIEAVWIDPAWRAPLENAVVRATDGDDEKLGFLRAAEAERGVGIVTLDGETEWIRATTIAIPHPILLEELDDLRALATELSLTQGVQQLFRETFARTAAKNESATSVRDFENAKFAQLNHALGKAKTLGYRVRGGFATCPVWEAGALVEARFWLGADAPEAEAYTGELVFVDDKERSLALGAVGPVAFSEGMRMASAIHAARVVEEKKDE